MGVPLEDPVLSESAWVDFAPHTPR
jgi:hypothetical protein